MIHIYGGKDMSTLGFSAAKPVSRNGTLLPTPVVPPAQYFSSEMAPIKQLFLALPVTILRHCSKGN